MALNRSACAAWVAAGLGLLVGCGPTTLCGLGAGYSGPDITAVPVVYAGWSEPVTEFEIRDILCKAETVRPADAEVWFIEVNDNMDIPFGIDYMASVYFAPDEASSRIRKGRYAWFTSDPFMPLLLPIPPTKPTLAEYRQVSLADEPFGEERGVPEGTLMPFRSPAEFTDEEIVKMVDAARAALPWASDDPILSIWAGDETIAVTMGQVFHAFLIPGGSVQTADLVRTDAGFEVVSTSGSITKLSNVQAGGRGYPEARSPNDPPAFARPAR